MTDDDYILSGPSMDDEAYYYAGTHRLVSDRPNYPTRQIVEDDVNASLNLDPALELASPIDLQNFDSTTRSVDIFSDDFDQTSFTFNQVSQGIDFDNLTAPRRTDSGLSPTAAPFTPSVQAWSNYNLNVAAVPQRSNRMLLTPLNTNVEAVWHSHPHSAPSRAQQAYPTAVSPSITLNDELQWPHSAIQGVQWPFDVPPAAAIGTWTQQQAGTFSQPTLIPNEYDPGMLTPTTPTYGGSALERTGSRTATSSMYLCDHEGCGKEFKSKTDYTHHKRNHGDRNHICPNCQKRFVFRKDLNRHIKTHSPNDRHFFCTVHDCVWAEKGFQRKDHYDRHLKTHYKTGMLTPTGSAAMSRSPSRR